MSYEFIIARFSMSHFPLLSIKRAVVCLPNSCDLTSLDDEKSFRF